MNTNLTAVLNSDQYQLLFNSIDEGISIIGKVDSKQNECIDFRYILTNPAFERITGLAGVIGKTVMEVVPEVNHSTMQVYDKIIKSGKSECFEAYEKAFEKWFGIHAFPIDNPDLKRIAVIFNDITERKQVEEALGKSEERFRMVQENSLARFTILKPFYNDQGEIIDFTYIYQNARAAETSRRSPSELIGLRMTEIWPTFPQTLFFTKYKQAAKTGLVTEFEDCYNADGVDDWFHATITPIPDGIAIATQIITERKRSETILRENEKRHDFLLHLSDILRPLSDPAEIHGAVTRTAMDYFGADRCYYCEIAGDDAIIRQDASRCDLPSITGVYPLSSLPIHKSLIDAGLPIIVTDVHTTEAVDGELRQLCIQRKVISYLDIPVIKNGKPVGILCITQCVPRDWTELEVELAVEVAERTWATTERAADIIERKKLEEELRYQKELFESVIENMNDALIIYNKEGRIEFMNAESRKLYPYLSKNITVDDAHYGFEYYDLENNIKQADELPSRRVFKGEKIKNEKILIKRPDKDQFTEVNATPIFNREGDLVTAVITHHDITDSVNYQRALKEQQEQLLISEREKSETLKEAIKLKDEFLYLITHEFKTPITVISSVIQSMDSSMKTAVPEKMVRYMNMIKMNTNRQLRLVNNLLDIAKMNSDNIKFNLETFDIVFVTKAIVKSVEVYAAQKDINLSFISSIDKKEIYFDEEKYERIMLNLLSNAMKFTPRGKCVYIGLSTEKYKDQDFVNISITDEGIGIPADKQQIIFERFGQADTSMSRQAEGTGLGLHLVKLLVDSIGGEISMRSEVGCGSTFTVLLPVTDHVESLESPPVIEGNRDILDLNNRIIQATSIEFSDIYFD